MSFRLVSLDAGALGPLLAPDETRPAAYLSPGRVKPHGRDRVADILDLFPRVSPPGSRDPRIDQLVGGPRRLASAARHDEAECKEGQEVSEWETHLDSLEKDLCSLLPGGHISRSVVHKCSMMAAGWNVDCLFQD